MTYLVCIPSMQKLNVHGCLPNTWEINKKCYSTELGQMTGRALKFLSHQLSNSMLLTTQVRSELQFHLFELLIKFARSSESNVLFSSLQSDTFKVWTITASLKLSSWRMETSVPLPEVFTPTSPVGVGKLCLEFREGSTKPCALLLGRVVVRRICGFHIFCMYSCLEAWSSVNWNFRSDHCLSLTCLLAAMSFDSSESARLMLRVRDPGTSV